jgi:hypothetical protein
MVTLDAPRAPTRADNDPEAGPLIKRRFERHQEATRRLGEAIRKRL